MTSGTGTEITLADLAKKVDGANKKGSTADKYVLLITDMEETENLVLSEDQLMPTIRVCSTEPASRKKLDG